MIKEPLEESYIISLFLSGDLNLEKGFYIKVGKFIFLPVFKSKEELIIEAKDFRKNFCLNTIYSLEIREDNIYKEVACY